MNPAAVLTGDLVGSTEAGPEAVETAMAALEEAALQIADWTNGADLRFTRSRGDGWQAMITPRGAYLRATVYFLAHLRRKDIQLATRIGIGFGAVTSVGTADLSDAHGPAFTNSGHALDQIGQIERLAAKGLRDSDMLWCNAALDTLAYLSGRWSVEQAEAIAVVALLKEKMPLFEIANNLNISRQALSSRLAVAGEKPIMAAIRAAEGTL